MAQSFHRPVGAAADALELEYVSALHQTEMPNIRKDGSIKDEDISCFLRSRYGIEVEPAEVRRTVLQGFGGGDDEDDGIDLMEMVTILLIPTLIKASQNPRDLDRGRDDGGVQDTDGYGQNPEKWTNEDEDEKDGGEEGKQVDEEEGQKEEGENSFEDLSRIPGSLPSRTMSKRFVRKDLIKYALDVILHDTLGSRNSKSLDRDMLRKILTSYGEAEFAEDDDLLDEMIRAASDGSGTVTLNVDSFVRGLTGDVLLYDVTKEKMPTTTLTDVFGVNELSGKILATDEEGGGSGTQNFKKVWTATSLDVAAGTYRSKLMVIGLWATIVISYFAYVYPLIDGLQFRSCQTEPDNRAKEFSCILSESVAKWFFTFFSACIGGLLVVGVGSQGNSLHENQSQWWSLIGILAVFIAYIRLFIDIDILQTSAQATYLYITSIILGAWVVLLHLLHIIYPFISRASPMKWKICQRIFQPDALKSEAGVKQAASHKIGMMTKNAVDVAMGVDKNSAITSHYGQALLKFSKLGTETAGGFSWTLKQLWNKELLVNEGIWIPARFLAGNFVMLILTGFILLSGIDMTMTAKLNYNPNATEIMFVNTDLVSNFISNHLEGQLDQALQKLVGFDPRGIQVQQDGTDYACSSLMKNVDYMNIACEVDSGSYNCEPFNLDVVCAAQDSAPVAQDAIKSAAEEAVQNFYPSRPYMVVAPLAVATAFSTLTAACLTIVYIPSVATTTLKLRSGVIPTFRNPHFADYRSNANMVTILLGSMFWGTLFASIGVGGIIGFVVFFFSWQVTLPLALRITALALGIGAVSLVRYLIQCVVQKKNFDAYYRRTPARTNIVQLGLEAANFAVSVGIILGRAVVFLFCAALFLGRIDTPFMAPGVGRFWGVPEIDMFPTIFMKDILAHEAHRHPYLERMGTMYMMKLRHGKDFGSRAGSCWRLLFVYALMPWLSKYRVLTKDSKSKRSGRGSTKRASLNFVSLRCFSLDDTEEIDEAAKSTRIDGSETKSKILTFSQDMGVTKTAHGDSNLTDLSAENETESLKVKNSLLKMEVATLKQKLKRLQNLENLQFLSMRNMAE